MKIKASIDIKIREELSSRKIEFDIDHTGRILVHEFRMDLAAKMGMAYVAPPKSVPDGVLPEVIISAPWVFCVFVVNNRAVIIELGVYAIEG
ncbi:MAG: hypothetical protein WBG70_04165 [Spirulinaceae cyanobacterium]